MRATLSVFCLLAVGISGLGFGLKPEFRENAPGIFSIQTAAARQPEYAGQPQGGFYFFFPKIATGSHHPRRSARSLHAPAHR
ncbi:MAG: hypothetical protein NVV59_12525 [Chitinophagaceae bacterium]|nr:hypothetical protein [Chitinophagaceae bacterium]